MAGKLDLDVNKPEAIPDKLRSAADQFLEDAGELDHYHQDESAGKPWRIIANELEKAADRIWTRLKKIGYVK